VPGLQLIGQHHGTSSVSSSVPSADALPGRQNIPIWLTIAVGIGAALLGAAIARGAGLVGSPGFDWTELLIQIVLAAVGVALVASFSTRRSRTSIR